MSAWDWGRAVVGNAIDYVGTKYKLPEAGISEAVAGGPTYNTKPAGPSSSSSNVRYGPVDTRTAEQKAASNQTSSNDYGTYSTSSTGTETPAFNQMFQGNVYNDMSAYMNAVYAAAQGEYDRQKKILDSNYERGLISFADKEKLMEQARTNIQTKADNIVYEYNANKTSLGENRDTSIQGQRGYFSAISPDVAQSQQGTYEGKVLNEYQRGVTELDRAKAQNEQAVQQAREQLAMEERNTSSGKEAYATEYQNRLIDLSNAMNQQKDETYNNLYSNLAGTPYESQMSAVGGYSGPTDVNTQAYNVTDMMNQIQALNLALNNLIGKQTTTKAKGSTSTASVADKTLKDYLYPVTA
jgi:hypothetical protein